MADAGTVWAELKAKTSAFESKINKAIGTIDRFGKKAEALSGKFDRMALRAGVAFAAIGVGAKKAISAASDFEEVTNVLDVTFGKQGTAQIDKWSADMGKAMGRSATQMRTFTSQMGAMLTPMVGSAKAAQGMSTEISKLAVDMASFMNTSDEAALTALRSGLSGETEPLKRFGVVMNEAALQAFALSKGIKGNVSQMTVASKTALRYQFIMEATKLSQGDAVRSAASFANQLKRLQGNLENVAVAIGNAILPQAARFLGVLNSVANVIAGLSPETLAMAGRIIALATAITGAVTGFSLFNSVALKLAATLAGALTASISPVLIAVIGLVAVLGFLRDNAPQAFDGIVEGAKNAIPWVKDNLGAAFRVLMSIVDAVIKGIIHGMFMIPKAVGEVTNMISAAIIRLIPVLRQLESIGLIPDGTTNAAKNAAVSLSKVKAKVDALKDAAMESFTFSGAMGAGEDIVDKAGVWAKKTGKTFADGLKSSMSGVKKIIMDMLPKGSEIAKQISSDISAGGDPTKDIKMEFVPKPIKDKEARGGPGAADQAVGILQAAGSGSLSSLGAALGSAIAPGIGSAIGGMIGSIIEAIPSAVATAFTGFGSILAKLTGSQELSQGLAIVGSVISGLVVALGVLALAIHTVLNLAVLPMIPTFLLLAAVLAPVILAFAAFAALASLLVVFAALTTQTESFKKAQKALGFIVQKVIKALEPFGTHMNAFVGLFDMFIDALMPVIDLFMSNETVLRVLFDAFKIGALIFIKLVQVALIIITAFQSMAWLIAQVGLGFQRLLKGIEDSTGFDVYKTGEITKAKNQIAEIEGAMADNVSAIQDMEDASRKLANATFDQAKAVGESVIKEMEAADAAKDLAQSMTNVPSGFKVAAARFNAADAVPGVDAAVTGKAQAGDQFIYFQITDPQALTDAVYAVLGGRMADQGGSPVIVGTPYGGR